MTINNLKSSIGFILLITHFLCLMVILYFGLVDGSYSEKETKSAIAILLPVFAVFTTAIIKHYVKNPYQQKGKSRQVSGIFGFITFSLPVILILFVLTILVNQAKYNKQVVEDFIFWLGMAETSIAVYIGIYIKELFEKEQPA